MVEKGVGKKPMGKKTVAAEASSLPRLSKQPAGGDDFDGLRHEIMVEAVRAVIGL